MTTYTLGDRITVRLKSHGAARDGEFVEQRGSRCKVLLDDEMDVRTVRMDQVSVVPARVEPILPPPVQRATVGRADMASEPDATFMTVVSAGRLDQPEPPELMPPPATAAARAEIARAEEKRAEDVASLGLPRLVAVPKPPKRWESGAYLAYVRASEACACCRMLASADDPIEASHHGPRGIGRKSDDTRAIPLLRSCHRYYHQHGVFRGPAYGGRAGGTTREHTDALAAETAARLVSEWCRMQGIDVDTIIINALTEALRERS